MENRLSNSSEVQRAYADYERRIYVRHLEVGSYLVMVLMPAGVVLDYFVYPRHCAHFFALRLLSTMVGGCIWITLQTRVRNSVNRHVSLVLALTPAFFICWMIYEVDGAASTYYAGLNLVLLSIALVMRWSADLSASASVLVILMYLGACYLHGSMRQALQSGVLANNLYFLSLTAIIVTVSGWIHQNLRFREYALNYQLDQNKRNLEATNVKLSEQNDALARANHEIREAEAQLIQSERMATLGRLSVSLLHDIRNPLTFAKQALFNLQDKSPTELSPTVHKQLVAIERGIERVEGIITPLYSFSHSASNAAELLDLADVLTTAHVFVSYELKDKNIVFEQHLTPGQTVFANRNQFISVLINLVENAIHALDLKTFPEGIPPSIRITGWVDDRRSFIAIRDNGPGIGVEQRDRLFKAFATTKKPGEGLGLGLNICYNNIRKAGGDLSVNTELGQFCEFVISLPADGAAAAAASTPVS